MNQPVELGKLLPRSSESNQFAKNWWNDEKARPLPGEDQDHTVFVIDFYDGCKYFGYTKEFVACRAASLATPMGGWGPNAFVQEHAQHVPYVIRCIRSNLDDQGAKELRGLLIAAAPENVHRGRGSSIQTQGCWLLHHEESPDTIPFLESIRE